jgi:hypothetical protein
VAVAADVGGGPRVVVYRPGPSSIPAHTLPPPVNDDSNGVNALVCVPVVPSNTRTTVTRPSPDTTTTPVVTSPVTSEVASRTQSVNVGSNARKSNRTDRSGL